MKKTRILILALLLLCALTLSACDMFKKDDNNSGDSNGTSGNGGAVCVHEYEDDVCKKCGATDPNYKPPCTHYYSNGVCALCGDVCAHTAYENGECKICGRLCVHNYTNGACTVCKNPCPHEYDKGRCTVCSQPCSHDFEGESCKTCGIDNPNYIPADGGESLYASIVEKYKYLVSYKKEFEELPPKGSNEPEYVDALYEVVGYYDPTEEMGYAFKDINSDGFKELILMQSTCNLYAIFTIVERAPVAAYVFQDGMGYLHSDGTVFYNLSYAEGGNKISSRHMTSLIDGKLVGIEYGWIDKDGDLATNDDTAFYTEDIDGVRTYLTKEDYDLVTYKYAYFWDYPTRLTRLAGLRFYSLSLKPVTNLKAADFSTYDAIIKTFGIMHTEVAGGKYVKTDWTAGDYNFSMLLDSDEDFYLYERLIGACVLVQNSSSATFGFAKKDLNGDGTDELILLEGTKHHVLAIFTEVSGKAVLLDTYNDLRTAFIDADGLIHVKQTVIPGYKDDDTLYTVYEIKDGKLSAKLSVGEEYRQSGKYSSEAYKWYKIEGGNRVELTEEEWNALYAEYALEIDSDEYSGKYNAYTEKSAGLTFVQVPLAEEN